MSRSRRQRVGQRKAFRGGVAAIIALSLQLAPVEAQAAPVRSGTILGAFTIGLGPVDCGTIPDCAAWWSSKCDERLAGRDPAVFASIVDISDLAGSTRVLVRDTWMVNIAQLWSGNCRAMDDVSEEGYIRIPAGARWLTITASVVPHQQWELW